jgi:hypothetical protein
MQTYEIALVIDREPTDEQLEVLPADALDKAGMVGFETEAGAVLVHVAREAASLADAIIQAVHEVESLGQLGLQVVGVHSDDLVSLRDIAGRTGRTYESVRLLASGKRGPGGFPTPLSTGQWALYSWAEVSAWLAMHYGGEAAGAFDRTLVAADHLIRARRILAGDKHRDEMVKLVAA